MIPKPGMTRRASLAMLTVGLAACELAPGSQRRTDTPAVVPTTGPATGLRIFDLPGLGSTWVYYPIEAEAGGEPAPEIGESALLAVERRFGPEARSAVAAVRSGARLNAEGPASDLPLALFMPGAGLGSILYHRLLERIASEGFLVVALHPQASPAASEGRYGEAVREFEQAMTSLLDPAHPSSSFIRPGPVALIGHSLGGAAASAALQAAPEGSVAVNIDGDFGGSTLRPAAGPILYLVGQTEGEWPTSRERRRRAWEVVRGGDPGSEQMHLPRMRHLDATDVSLVAHVVPPERRRNRLGDADLGQVHYQIGDLTTAWLRRWLRADSQAWAAALTRVSGFVSRDRVGPR